MRHGLAIALAACVLAHTGDSHARPSAAAAPPMTFFAVHCEPYSVNSYGWQAIKDFVAMADRYGGRLTLMFSPQWAEYIVPNPERLALVKAWQRKGHEVAVHYHNVVHSGWNGHTNRTDERYVQDPRHRGSVADMMAPLRKLAEPETMLTMCMGPDRLWDSLEAIEVDETDYPDGVVYDADGMDVGLGPLMRTRFRGKDLYHLKHHFFAPGQREGHLDRIIEEFQRAKPSDVLGVVTHETDFGANPRLFERWFRFCKEHDAPILTVREIVKRYPRDSIVSVSFVAQEVEPPTDAGGILAKVRRLQALLQASRGRGEDTSAAQMLDRRSREAAARGDMREATRLLEEAILALTR